MVIATSLSRSWLAALRTQAHHCLNRFGARRPDSQPRNGWRDRPSSSLEQLEQRVVLSSSGIASEHDLTLAEARHGMESTATAQLVFIDPAVPEYRSLLSEPVGAGSNSALGNRVTRNGITRVIVLDPGRDGVDQVTRVLGNYQHISAVHIVSHGESGTLWLGNSQVDPHRLGQ